MKPGGSHHGFHYYQEHKKCPWRFYLMKGLGILPVYTPKALTDGSAFHLGKEAWYKTWNKSKALDAVYDFIEENQSEYQYEDEYENALSRIPTMLDSWIEQVGIKDKINLDIIEVELELEVPIAQTPYTLTMKIDLVAKEKSSNIIYIYDTKTTGFSIDTTLKSFDLSDQPTTYLWGINKMTDLNPAGARADITYWSKKSNKPSLIQHKRGDVVYRSEQSLNEYEEALGYEIADISAKMDAVGTGRFRPTSLFQRYTHTCTEFFRECPYKWICRDNAYDKEIPLPGDLHYSQEKTKLTDPIYRRNK